MDFYEEGETCYLEGNYDKAMEWYLKAAAQNNRYAQNNIGYLYHIGIGVNVDYKKAMEWYLKAAKQTNSTAQTNIGKLYEEGKGVDRNYDKAIELNIDHNYVYNVC